MIEEANQAVAEAYQLASKRIEDAYQNACRILNKESKRSAFSSICFSSFLKRLVLKSASIGFDERKLCKATFTLGI